MLAFGEPRRVLIVGGGDGGSLQHVLRYPSVEEALVCELDQRAADLSREHFAASFGDPWADPRAELLVRDAFGFLEEDPGQFDVIISDTTDPIGMAEHLFRDWKRTIRLERINTLILKSTGPHLFFRSFSGKSCMGEHNA
jgi:spermidine synthase